ncbi:Uncharacterised protein g11109 [Pycnogonum litorale]
MERWLEEEAITGSRLQCPKNIYRITVIIKFRQKRKNIRFVGRKWTHRLFVKGKWLPQY